MSDRRNPTIWDAWQAVPIDDQVRAVLVRDQQRWTRRYIRPSARVVSRAAVTLIIVVKRVVPLQFRSHRMIDKLCIWFMRRFVSQDAAWLLLRHFSVETNLINFVARNSGVAEVDLQPKSIGDLNKSAVIEHDINLYNLVIDIAESTPATALDYSMLTIPELDTEPQFRRLINLDLETALCLMNIAFCFFTTEDEYERAINSLQLDEALMAALSELTGDVVFRTWRPLHPMVALSVARDVPRELYWHAVIDEYAHTRLSRRY